MSSVKLKSMSFVLVEESNLKVVLVGFAVSRVKAAPMDEDVLFALSPSFRVILICALVL